MQDAIDIFMDSGLKAIQRGYNCDDQQPDSYICSSGSFNKIIECLTGVIEGIFTTIITKEMISQAIPTYIEQALEEQHKKNALDINSEPEDIWPIIKDDVVEKMWEYGSTLYGGHRDHEDFKKFIADLEYVYIYPIADYKEKHESSSQLSR